MPARPQPSIYFVKHNSGCKFFILWIYGLVWSASGQAGACFFCFEIVKMKIVAVFRGPLDAEPTPTPAYISASYTLPPWNNAGVTLQQKRPTFEQPS